MPVLPIVGPSYSLPSIDINAQRCINYYVTTGGPDARAATALVTTPGLKSLIDTGGSVVRALMEFDDTFFAVVDDTFYEITVDTVALTATKTSRGTLNSTTGYISWDINPTQLAFVDGDSGYTYTKSTTTFAETTDVDFTGGVDIVFFDGFFFYNTPNASTVFNTALNDGTSVNAIDFFTAEGRPDESVGLAMLKRDLWVIGTDTVEIYFDAANSTGSPLSRRDGAFIERGCSAVASIKNFNDSLVWLDDRGYIVMADGYSTPVISTEPINAAIAGYSTISDAIAYVFEDRGHPMYIISFPTGKATWVFDSFTGQWHERAYWNTSQQFEHHLVNVHHKFGRLDIGGSRRDGNIYVISHDYLDDAGETLRRLRTTAFQHQEFSMTCVDALYIHMETGRGLTTGQGSDPQIMMRYAWNGGIEADWSNELTRSIGKIGEYATQVSWHRLGAAREWIFEFSVSDPVPHSIIDAAVDISGTGIN